MRSFQKNFLATFIIFTVIFTLSLCPSASYAKTCGVICAMKERAAVVTQMKNNFVMKVLAQYQIAFHNTTDGVISQIQVDDKWQDIESIDIVPEVTENPQGIQVTGHNIFFHTKAGVLHLTTDMAIKR